LVKGCLEPSGREKGVNQKATLNQIGNQPSQHKKLCILNAFSQEIPWKNPEKQKQAWLKRLILFCEKCCFCIFAHMFYFFSDVWLSARFAVKGKVESDKQDWETK